MLTNYLHIINSFMSTLLYSECLSMFFYYFFSFQLSFEFKNQNYHNLVPQNCDFIVIEQIINDFFFRHIKNQNEMIFLWNYLWHKQGWGSLGCAVSCSFSVAALQVNVILLLLFLRFIWNLKILLKSYKVINIIYMDKKLD